VSVRFRADDALARTCELIEELVAKDVAGGVTRARPG
jgi:hypothetical protein